MTPTHAFCPRCNCFEPCVFSPIKKETYYPNGDLIKFEGMSITCRVCQFEITQIGVIHKSNLISSKEPTP